MYITSVVFVFVRVRVCVCVLCVVHVNLKKSQLINAPGCASFTMLYSKFLLPPTPQLWVERLRGSHGAAAATIAYGGGTAAPQIDFIAPLQSHHRLQWADGDSKAKAFTIRLCESDHKHKEKTIYYTLSDAEGVMVGAQSSATVVIEDEPQNADLDERLRAMAFAEQISDR